MSSENNPEPVDPSTLNDAEKKALEIDGLEWLASNEKDGIQCDKCGCRRSKVYRSDPVSDARMRERECLHCGHRYHTYERKS